MEILKMRNTTNLFVICVVLFMLNGITKGGTCDCIVDLYGCTGEVDRCKDWGIKIIGVNDSDLYCGSGDSDNCCTQLSSNICARTRDCETNVILATSYQSDCWAWNEGFEPLPDCAA